jgi:ribonuclease VapC
MSAATFLEASIVIEARYGQPGITKLDELLGIAQVSIEPVTHEQALAAREAYRRFGKGRHPAGLNYGDCFAYALSLQSGEPLLFKGTDFAHTDVAQVL